MSRSHRAGATLRQHRRRTTAVVVGCVLALSCAATAIVLVVAQHDARDDKIAESGTLLLRFDELNESLRGDLLSLAPGDQAGSDALSDLEALRSAIDHAEVSTLPAGSQVKVRELLSQERHYSDEVAAGLDEGSANKGRHAAAALEDVDGVTARVDAEREALQALSDRQVRATSTLEHRLLAALGLLAALCMAVSVLAVRRVLGHVEASLGTLTGAVRAVSSGDMSARTGLRREDAMGELALVLDDMADGLGDAMARLRAGYADEEGRGRFARALEQTDTEPEVYSVVSRAVTALTPSAPSRLLIADSSEMHLLQVAGNGDLTGSCEVESPGSCPAIRGGRTLLMTSSGDLDACPRLRDREGQTVSAVCTPVTFLGKALGVVQVLDEEGTPTADRTLHSLHDIAHLAGSRIGTMRALSQAQRQATIDPLTGLLNRRTLEDRVRTFALSGAPYAVALLDLDHFKNLNDSRGHEVGDRALTTFAQVLRDNLRHEDVIARYGGEEFVVVFPDCDAEQAMTALLHVRGALRQAVVLTGVEFTFSAGVTDSRCSESWQAQLRTADAGLLACKQNGRDRIAFGDLVQEERRQHQQP